MNKQTRQLAAVITGQTTSDGVGVKLKRIVSQQQNALLIGLALSATAPALPKAPTVGALLPTSM